MLANKPKTRVNTLNMKDYMLVSQFDKYLGCAQEALLPTSYSSDSWSSLSDVIYNKVVKTFSFCNKRIPDQFKVHIDTIGQALDQQRIA